MKCAMWLASFSLVLPETAVTCSLRAFELHPVRPSFTVVVTHRGKVISGADVSIITGAEGAPPVLSTKTNESGSVNIDGLEPGKYYLVATYKEIEAGREWIEVGGTSKKARTTFKFQWAGYSERVKRISGSLTGMERGNTGNPLQDLLHAQKVPERGVQIRLHNAFSGEDYSVISDSEGRFWFDLLSPGTYILKIGGGAKSISGVVADVTTFVIDLSTSAKTDFLVLALKDSGCGGAAYELETSN